MIWICAFTLDEIANWDTERRNFSVRFLSEIYGTSYGAIVTMYPSGNVHIIFFTFIHCKNRIFCSLVRIKVRLLQPHTYIAKVVLLCPNFCSPGIRMYRILNNTVVPRQTGPTDNRTPRIIVPGFSETAKGSKMKSIAYFKKSRVYFLIVHRAQPRVQTWYRTV